jgi:hypothetical protein
MARKNVSVGPHVVPDMTLLDFQHHLFRWRIEIVNLRGKEGEYTCRLRRDGRLFYGCGSTLCRAVSDAMDEIFNEAPEATMRSS